MVHSTTLDLFLLAGSQLDHSSTCLSALKADQFFLHLFSFSLELIERKGRVVYTCNAIDLLHSFYTQKMASVVSKPDARLNGQPGSRDAILELADGSVFTGTSFGAEGKSVAGECVFQTGKFQNRSRII